MYFNVIQFNCNVIYSTKLQHHVFHWLSPQTHHISLKWIIITKKQHFNIKFLALNSLEKQSILSKSNKWALKYGSHLSHSFKKPNFSIEKLSILVEEPIISKNWVFHIEKANFSIPITKNRPKTFPFWSSTQNHIVWLPTWILRSTVKPRAQSVFITHLQS